VGCMLNIPYCEHLFTCFGRNMAASAYATDAGSEWVTREDLIFFDATCICRVLNVSDATGCPSLLRKLKSYRASADCILPWSRAVMRFFAVSTLALSAVVSAQSDSVDQYISSEGPIAKAGLLANIGPDGSKSSGAKASILSCSMPHNITDLSTHRLE
jgi:hypothetical protein